MAYQHLQAGMRDGVLMLTLDRPDVLNSFNARMAEDLRQALDTATTDAAVRSILITGNGRAFCAGQDLGEVLPAEGAAQCGLGEVVARQYSPLVRAIGTIEK